MYVGCTCISSASLRRDHPNRVRCCRQYSPEIFARHPCPPHFLQGIFISGNTFFTVIFIYLELYKKNKHTSSYFFWKKEMGMWAQGAFERNSLEIFVFSKKRFLPAALILDTHALIPHFLTLQMCQVLTRVCYKNECD